MSEPVCYYHMSGSKLATGTMLRGNGLPKVAVAVEEALEEHRPKDKISRYEAVFTAPVPRFHRLGLECGYVHTVMVPEPRELHDTYWIGKLQFAEIKRRQGWNQSQYLAWTPELLDRVSGAYWSGEESPEPIWECLSREAEVTALLSNECVLAKDTADGWNPAAKE